MKEILERQYRPEQPRLGAWGGLWAITATIAAIYLSSRYTYLLFHGLVEVVSIAIAFAIFILVWNTRTYHTNNYLYLLGIGYAFSAFIDLLHTFSFKGMTVFSGYGDNLAPQLWLAARYLQAVTLVAAPLVMQRKTDDRLIFGGYAAAVAVLLALIYSGHFPDCLIAGKGLTPFKKNSEYLISFVLLVAWYLVSRQRSHFSDKIYLLIVSSIMCTIVSELCFTAFVSMYDVANKIGHIAKLVAFYLVYRAILATGLQEPFGLIFRELKQTEDALRRHRETLEEQVRERTVSLELEVGERQRAQEELVRLNEELEQRVRTRTAELSDKNMELQRAKDAADLANRAKSVFLANMSHELRTPLNAVLGFAQLMRNDRHATAEQREYLNIINRSGEYLLHLISNVLDLSKIEAGRVELEESSLDLHQMLQEMKSLMNVRVAEKSICFTLEQSADLPRLIAVDGGKLRQVLINLIGNAIKYTSSGGVTLRAMVGEQESAERVRLRFEVEDTGPGIHEEDRERIFHPFVQLGERSAAEAGTGLGLAISRQYVELMGGHIGVDSEPGKGSLFYFEIPAARPPAGHQPAVTPRGRVAGLAAGQRSYRLLIAEDQAENRLLLRKLLEPFGFALREAVNGEEAVAACEEWRPDLVFMDIRMPVMDGLTATRRIKSADAGAQTRVVAVTAHALEEERREILAAGCDDLIRKPYEFADILDALAKNIGVRFVYEEEAVPAAVTTKLEAAALAGLPPELRRGLEQALGRIDIEAVGRAIEEIRVHDPALADGLAVAAQDLQFGRVLRLIRTAPGKPSTEEGT